jgi:hypothetical protein
MHLLRELLQLSQTHFHLIHTNIQQVDSTCKEYLMDENTERSKLLSLLKQYIENKKVKSPGEAENLFLSRIDSKNSIKQIIILKSQGSENQELREELIRKIEGKMR